MEDVNIKDQKTLFDLWWMVEKFNIQALEESPENPTRNDGFILWFIRDNTLNEKPKNTKGLLILEMVDSFDGLSDKQLKCLLAAHRDYVFLLRTLSERFFVTPEECPRLKGAGRDHPAPLNLICMPGN